LHDSVGNAEPRLHFVHLATTVAGAALPVPQIADLHIFFPSSLARWRIDFHLLETELSPGFRIPRFSLGGATFAASKTRLLGLASPVQALPVWFRGRNFGFHLGVGGGSGGGGASGISVTGCHQLVTRKCNGRSASVWEEQRKHEMSSTTAEVKAKVAPPKPKP